MNWLRKKFCRHRNINYKAHYNALHVTCLDCGQYRYGEFPDDTFLEKHFADYCRFLLSQKQSTRSVGDLCL